MNRQRISRERATFTTALMVVLANPRLGLTTQARQHGSVGAAFRES
jgi:hypothetical protein